LNQHHAVNIGPNELKTGGGDSEGSK
jgi:hypothetical protein